MVLLLALVGDPITKKYPEESRLINEIGVLQVINQIHGKGIERLIFCFNVLKPWTHYSIS